MSKQFKQFSKQFKQFSKQFKQFPKQLKQFTKQFRNVLTIFIRVSSTVGLANIQYIYIYCSFFYHKVTVSWPQTISHRHIISWPQHLLMFLHLGFIPSGSNMCRRKRAPIYDLFHGEKGWNRMECDCFPYVYSDKSKWSKCLVSGYCNNPCWSMLIHVIIFIPSRDRHRRAPPSLSRPKSLRAGRSPLRMKHDEPPKFWLFDRESDD